MLAFVAERSGAPHSSRQTPERRAVPLAGRGGQSIFLTRQPLIGFFAEGKLKKIATSVCA
jgi:hypothetical protein